jgi:serine/threonine protein kinase
LRPPIDYYSAGATLDNRLTNQFSHDMPNRIDLQIAIVLTGYPIPVRSRRPDLPEGLAQIIDRSLAKEPKDRFPSAEAMRRALLPFAR